MITKLIIVCLIVCVGAAAVIGYGIVSGRITLRGDGEGGILPVVVTMTAPEDAVVVGPSSLLIEIHEELILYNSEEISLDELEAILERYSDTDDIWVLQDAFRADNFTFNSVRDLLRAHNMIFVEQ